MADQDPLYSSEHLSKGVELSDCKSTPFWNVQAASDKPVVSQEDKEKLMEKYKQKCKDQKPKGPPPPPRVPTKEELGVLISDKECEFDNKATAALIPIAAFGAVPILNTVNRLRKKAPLPKGFTGVTGLLAAVTATGLVGAWKQVRSDQLYHNNSTRTFTYRCSPIVGDPYYTVVGEKSVKKIGVETIRWLKETVNALPDGFEPPIIYKDDYPPIIITKHEIPDLLKKNLYSTKADSSKKPSTSV